MTQNKYRGRASSRDGSRHSSARESGPEMGAHGHRRERLQHLIGDALAALLRDEVADPRLAPVRISEITLSEDGSSARVLYVVLERPGESVDRPGAAAALERATGFFHARLAQALDLKRLPKLRFTLLGAVAAEPEREDPWNE